VIDRLRMWLNRPLRDGDRPRLFALAVAAILAGAGALAFLGQSPPRRAPTHRTPAPPPRWTSPPPALPADTGSSEVPSEEGRPTLALHARHNDVETAKRAARRFLAGYLPYTYGRRNARSIAGATAGLRRRLAARPPRVPARAAHRRPRVVLLQTEGASRTRAAIVALVGDGPRRYSVELELIGGRSGWKVTDVGD
jgi:hypothetical protein